MNVRRDLVAMLEYCLAPPKEFDLKKGSVLRKGNFMEVKKIRLKEKKSWRGGRYLERLLANVLTLNMGSSPPCSITKETEEQGMLFRLFRAFLKHRKLLFIPKKPAQRTLKFIGLKSRQKVFIPGSASSEFL